MNNTFSYAMGAASQYLNNVSLGAFAALAVHGDLSLIENESYQQGRELGAMVSDAQAKFEIATGIGMAAAGTAAIAPTLGGGGVCALATAGVCALPAGGALVAEGAMVAGGGALAGHGTGVLLYAKSHPVESKTFENKSGQRQVVNGEKIGVDWEATGKEGRVHVQVGTRKFYIDDPSDLSALPKHLQKDRWLQDEIRKRFENLQEYLNK
ncbi:hypothetical protein [Candidatus Amarolinea dominans]|uniref:hypothetical protein n=1 Tax=Candidatus Amarolinea dominans TaxID=3140696 RepID=UPI001DD8D295|nr:hypothetical protein [Anaerolineae bacterium]